METNKLILKQVALKSATHLVNNQFKIDQDISTQVDTVLNIANQFNEWLLDGYQDDLITKVESAGMKAEVKSVTSKGSEASDAQKKFVKDLFANLPEEEQQQYASDVNAESMTWQMAKEYIPLFQEIIEKAKKKTDEAPF